MKFWASCRQTGTTSAWPVTREQAIPRAAISKCTSRLFLVNTLGESEFDSACNESRVKQKLALPLGDHRGFFRRPGAFVSPNVNCGNAVEVVMSGQYVDILER
jgi:hypothetical protein